MINIPCVATLSAKKNSLHFANQHNIFLQGHIYINGTKMDEVRDWYISSTGYVLQLANPYYEELTVRENLTLAAQIKLSNHYTLREKFQRVEQVMFVVRPNTKTCYNYTKIS